MRTSRRALAMAGAFPLALTWAAPAGAQTADNTPTPSASSTPAGIGNLNNDPFWNVHPYLQRPCMAEAEVEVEVKVSWQAPRAAVWLPSRGAPPAARRRRCCGGAGLGRGSF